MTMKTIVNTTPGCADPWDADSISVDQALSQITNRILALQDCEELPIRDCLGRISSESVISPINVPGHANSAMDGFAVPAESLPEDLRIRYRYAGGGTLWTDPGADLDGLLNGLDIVEFHSHLDRYRLLAEIPINLFANQ